MQRLRHSQPRTAGKAPAGLQPVCGRCKAPLTVSSGLINVTDASFQDSAERSPVPVLLDIWAPWRGPRRMIAPIVEDLAA